MGRLVSNDRLLKPGRIRLLFFLIAIVAYGVTEFGRFVYRPYVRQHGMSDWGLADSIGNLGGIVVQIFLTIAAFNSTKKQSFIIAPLLAVGYIAYEFLQPILPKGVFDWKDVLGTLIGLAAALVILWIVWRYFGAEAEEHEKPEADE